MTLLVSLGHEPALAAIVHALRAQPGGSEIDVVAIADATTASRIGVRSIAPAVDSASDPHRVEVVLRTALGHDASLAGDDPAWALIETVAQADAVLVAGGDRVATETLVSIASTLAKPIVVAVQPGEPDPDVESAALVGRFEDAAGLTPNEKGIPLEMKSGAHDGLVIHVTSTAHALRDSMASIVHDAERVTGLTAVTIDDSTSPAQIAWLASSAALVVTDTASTASAALAAGVPTVGIDSDITGPRPVLEVLASRGLRGWAIGPLVLISSEATAVVEATWSDRGVLANHLRRAAEDAAVAREAWWDAVTAVVTSSGEPDAPARPPVAVDLALPDVELATRIETANAEAARIGGLFSALDHDRRALQISQAASEANALESQQREIELAALVDVLERRLELMSADNLPVTAETTAPGPVLAQDFAAESALELERVLLEREAVEQHLFERERLVAVLGRRIHELESVTSAPPEELEGAHQAVRILQTRVAELEAQVADLLKSTSWRVSTPLRVAKNPRPYIRKLRSR